MKTTFAAFVLVSFAAALCWSVWGPIADGVITITVLGWSLWTVVADAMGHHAGSKGETSFAFFVATALPIALIWAPYARLADGVIFLTVLGWSVGQISQTLAEALE